MKLTCVVDNAVKPSSPYWGEHGLSFLIESGDQRVLFDTGASGMVLLHNLALVEVSPKDLTAVVLSHGHYDHTGGLAALLPLHPGLPIFAHPGVLRERFARKEGKLETIGLPMNPDHLRTQANLYTFRERHEVIPGVWTTGEIKLRPEPEGRGESHCVRQGDDWIPDPYEDDQALVIKGAEGYVLVCGCSHAGLLNTVEQMCATFGEYPKRILGGTHLASADAAYLKHVVDRLQQVGVRALYPNHCTGQKAFALMAASSDRVFPCPAGTSLIV